MKPPAIASPCRLNNQRMRCTQPSITLGDWEPAPQVLELNRPEPHKDLSMSRDP